MKSLQVLSILSFDKTKELKKTLTPKHYYCLCYEIDNIAYNSKYLFEREERLVENLIIILEKENFPSCQLCFPGGEWNKDEVKYHILVYKHYKMNEMTYKINELTVLFS